MVLLRHDDGADNVSQKSGEARRKQRSTNPEQTNQRGINVKVFGDTAAHTAEFLVRHRTIKFLLFHICLCVLFRPSGMLFMGAKIHAFSLSRKGQKHFFSMKKFVMNYFNKLIINYVAFQKFVLPISRIKKTIFNSTFAFEKRTHYELPFGQNEKVVYA